MVVALYRKGLPPSVSPLASTRNATLRLSGTKTLEKVPQAQSATKSTRSRSGGWGSTLRTRMSTA